MFNTTTPEHHRRSFNWTVIAVPDKALARRLRVGTDHPEVVKNASVGGGDSIVPTHLDISKTVVNLQQPVSWAKMKMFQI